MRKAGGVGYEKPILQEPYHTLIQFNCYQPWARVGASMAKMNRSNTSTCTEKNRWGLFFINGVGVKLAGWAHVATHWIECLVYLGCFYRLGDDSVYSSEKTQWYSINVTNQPHQQFIRFYTDSSGGRGMNWCLKVRQCHFNDQILTSVCNGWLWLPLWACLIFLFMLLKATSNSSYQLTLCVSVFIS